MGGYGQLIRTMVGWNDLQCCNLVSVLAIPFGTVALCIYTSFVVKLSLTPVLTPHVRQTLA